MEERLIEFAQGTIRKLFEAEGVIEPIAIVARQNESPLFLAPDFSSPEAKDESFNKLIAIAEEEGSPCVIVIAEAWLLLVPLDQVDLTEVRPSTDPNRKEIVQVTSYRQDGSTFVTFAFIERPEAGRPTLGKWEVTTPTIDPATPPPEYLN